MGKKKLVLPKGYKHTNINMFFKPKPATSEQAPLPSSPQHNQVNINVNADTYPAQPSVADISSQSSEELIFEESLAPRTLKRLRRGSDHPQNSVASQENSIPLTTSTDSVTTDLNNSSSFFYTNSDYESETESESENEELRPQLNDDKWLKRATDTLRPLSNPVSFSQTLGEEFKKLKKQWGYTGKYKTVDADSSNCCLCAHKHVGSLFKIKNIHTQKITYPASHCILQFRALDENNQPLGKKESAETIKKHIQAAQEDRNAFHKKLRSYFL